MAPAAQGIPLTAAGPFAAANGALPTGGGATLHAHNFAAAAAAAAAAQQQQQQQQQQQTHQILGNQAAAYHLAAGPAALKSSTLSGNSFSNTGPVVSLPSAIAHQTSSGGSNLVTPSAGAIINSSASGASGGGAHSAPSSTSQGKMAGSPAAKKFRPAFARPSHKGSRYIPKPIPQELGNLKTYSKPIWYS